MNQQIYIPINHSNGTSKSGHLLLQDEAAPVETKLPAETTAKAIDNVYRHEQWWERVLEVTLVREHSIKSLMPVLRFRFLDADAFGNLLLRCSSDQLNMIHGHLYRPTSEDAGTFRKLDDAQKIKMLKESMQPDCSAIRLRWVPAEYTEKGPEDIATAINEESNLLFGKVPFEGWLRHALGYQDASVQELFGQHNILRSRLYQHLSCDHPEERGKYAEVQQVNLVPDSPNLPDTSSAFEEPIRSASFFCPRPHDIPPPIRCSIHL